MIRPNKEDRGYTPNHTCWWLQGAHGQERKRYGTGSHSVVSPAQCLGHRSEERKEAGDQNSPWSLLTPQTASLWPAQGSAEQPHWGYGSMGAGEEPVTGTRRIRRPKFWGTWALAVFSLPLLPPIQTAPSLPALTCDPGLLSI